MDVGGDGEAEVEAVTVEQHPVQAGLVGFDPRDEVFEVAASEGRWTGIASRWVKRDLGAGAAGDPPVTVMHGSVVEGAEHHEVTFGARRRTSGT